MSKEIEIEKKNLLTEEEYNSIYKEYFSESEQFFTQVNSYFDTKDLNLKNTGSALRIRTKENFAEITLKTPFEDNLLEINEPLNLNEVEKLIKKGQFIPRNEIGNKLIEMEFPKETTVYLLTKLTTRRVEKKLEKGLLVLDQSWYGDTSDFELEIEADTVEDANELFNHILHQFSIPERETPNKILRAMQKLNLN